MDSLGEQIAKMAVVVGWSAVKNFVGIMFALGFNLGFLWSVILSTSGGMIGVFIFRFFDKPISRFWAKIRGEKRKKKKVRFSSSRRRIVKFRSKYGLPGIALLTPILLSVPIGTLMALRVTHNTYRISMYMLGSFLLYSLLFSGLYYGFHDFFMRVFADYLPK